MRMDDHFSKRITFFLCTRNRLQLMTENLDRFRALKKPNDELIVVDGGSTDGTAEMLASHVGTVIDRFVTEPDRSEGEALNKAVLLASGKYLKVLTDDDIFHSDAIEQAYEVMERNSDVDVLVCGGTVEYEGTNIVETRWVPPGVNYGRRPGDVFDYHGNGLGLMIRHASLCRTGLFNPKAFSLDNDFISHCIDVGATVRFCRLNVSHHIVYKHSCSMAQGDRLRKDQARIARRHGRNDWAYIKFPRNKVEQLFGLYYRYRKNFFQRLVWKLSGTRPPPPPPIWDGGFS